jgi:hypothetical protein
LFLQGQPDFDAATIGRTILRGKTRAFAVDQFQTLARIREAHAATPARIAFRRQTRPVIINAYTQQVTITERGHVD